jgi:hypothetical protein
MLCLPHHAITTHSKQGRKLHVVQAWVSPTEEIIKSNIDGYTGKFSWWMGSHRKELQGLDHGGKSWVKIIAGMPSLQN